MRGRRQSTFASPVLVGAVTLLAVLVAVFLAYNANTGLPFVPTRQLKVDIADGANIVPNNDVLEGGHRIGLVSAVAPIRLSNGLVGAQLTLKLSQNEGKVPVDSFATVRLRSILGSKYVDLIKGTSPQVIPDGGTMTLSRTSVPVQLDQVLDTFNAPTRQAIQTNLAGYGNAFTGRGADLNSTISSLPELFSHLTPVATYLAAPSSGLTRFLDNLNAFTTAVQPVSPTFARLFGDMATTFHAISQSPQDLEATIAESPSTLEVSTDSLRTQQPFLVDFASFGRNLAPATADLRQALPYVNPALETGSRVLRRTPVLNTRLKSTMGALKRLALAPGTDLALNALLATVTTLNPMIRYLGPYQTVCDNWNYTWSYLQDVVSERTSFGNAQRGMLMSANSLQANNAASEPASVPYNGGVPDSPLGGNGFYHGQIYGSAIDNLGNADCEWGQRGYPKQLNYFDPQHRQWATDPHTPGNQGPTFAGIAHVPAGETFSRNPQTGPQLPYNPVNP